MKSILFLFGLTFTLVCDASFTKSPVRPIVARVLQETTALESSIQKQLITATGFSSLKDFNVNWKSLTCYDADNMETDTVVGSCFVTAGAFQVLANVNLTVTDTKILPTILVSVVE